MDPEVEEGQRVGSGLNGLDGSTGRTGVCGEIASLDEDTSFPGAIPGLEIVLVSPGVSMVTPGQETLVPIAGALPTVLSNHSEGVQSGDGFVSHELCPSVKTVLTRSGLE